MKVIFENLKLILSKKQRLRVVILVSLLIVCAALEVCGVSSVLPILSALLDREFMYENAYARALCTFLSVESYPVFVMVCIAVLLLIFLAKNIMLIVKNCYHADFSLEFQYEIRKKLFNIYLDKDYDFFLNSNSSDIMKTLFDDVGKVYATFDGLLKILTDGIIDVFLLTAVFVIDWRLSLGMSAVLILVLLGVSRIIRPTIRKYGVVANESVQERNKWIIQAVQGIKTVKTTQKGEYFDRIVSDTDRDFSTAEKYHAVLSDLPKMIIEMLSVLSLMILISFLVIRGENFETLIPRIGAIGVATLKLLPGVNSISSNLVGIQYRIPALLRVSALLKSENSSKKTVQGQFPDRYENEIRVSHVSFRYGENEPYVIEDASLDIPIGKMIGIVGISGEGKTTFVDILLGLLYPETGEVCVDGACIERNPVMWRNSIGYITQDVFLLDDSILANVAFGIDGEKIDEQQAWHALEQAQLAEFVRGLPDGIHTQIGERGVRLSGGQCQRVGIARALYGDPQILIFDEATSSLDIETEAAVVKAINSLYGKHTMIVISHKSKALEQCDMIYRIENGRFSVVS